MKGIMIKLHGWYPLIETTFISCTTWAEFEEKLLVMFKTHHPSATHLKTTPDISSYVYILVYNDFGHEQFEADYYIVQDVL